MAYLPDDRLSAALAHRFQRPALLEEALTHASYTNENPAVTRDNERLEFLGDSVLGLAVSSLLWRQFPEASEGHLTQRRADVVCEATLAKVARRIRLHNYLRLGRGEANSGGAEKPRLLSSALEACIGAVYLDGGYAAAERCVTALVTPELAGLAFPGERDAKGRLQAVLQAVGEEVPDYRLVELVGPAHDQTFTIELHIAGERRARASAASRLEAERLAADQVLKQLSS